MHPRLWADARVEFDWLFAFPQPGSSTYCLKFSPSAKMALQQSFVASSLQMHRIGCPECNITFDSRFHPSTFAAVMIGAIGGAFLGSCWAAASLEVLPWISAPLAGAVLAAVGGFLILLPFRKCPRCEITFQLAHRKGGRRSHG